MTYQRRKYDDMSNNELRPAFHFTAKAGWINDPLGLTWKDGQYHLFYQYVPDRTTWASNCHWGHATSPDMIAWTEQGIAVAPGDGDDGVWSGSIVTAPDGAATMFYTSVTEPDIGIGTVRTATPDDASWNAWTKGAKMMSAPPELGVLAYRDPFVFRDGGQWRMFVGAGLEGGTAAAVSYSSPDLSRWTLDGIAAQRAGTEADPVWTGTMWECPQLFDIDGSHVLVTSIWEDDVLHYVAYGVGSYSDGKFKARSWGQLSFGKSYYAPSFFRDKEGAPTLIFWIRGVISPEGQWASALSVPHTLTLDGDTLVATPHKDLDNYLEPAQPSIDSSGSFNASLAAGADLRWTTAQGEHIQIQSAGQLLATLIHDGKGIAVTVEGNTDFHEARMPVASGSRIRAVVDKGIIELSTSQGIMAFPLPVHADMTVVATGFTEAPELLSYSQNATSSDMDPDNPRLPADSRPFAG